MKMGCFVTKNGSKMGHKCFFPKLILKGAETHRALHRARALEDATL